MIDYKLKKLILDAAKEEFIEVAHAVGQACHEKITKQQRPFPKVTYREFGVGVTGKIAGSPRDVVDSGALRDSLEIEEELAGENPESFSITYKWHTDYAEDIYLGVDQPAYPWVHIACNDLGL